MPFLGESLEFSAGVQLTEAGTEPGTVNGIAIPMSGKETAAKNAVADLVSITGYDAIDAGTLEQSWRLQPRALDY